MKNVLFIVALGTSIAAGAKDLQMDDCRPRAFANQLQNRILFALNREDLAQTTSPTLNADELQYVKTRVAVCDAGFYGPRRGVFNGRIAALKADLEQRSAQLRAAAGQRADLCQEPNKEKCRDDVRAAFEDAIAKLGTQIQRDINFYADQIDLMQSDRFDAMAPAYEAAFFADQLAHMLRDNLQSLTGVKKFEAIQIKFENGGDQILAKSGNVDKMIRHISQTEQLSLHQKFGTPLPNSLASRCDTEICLDPELIYAKFNSEDHRSGLITIAYQDANYTHLASLNFELNAVWAEVTFAQVAEAFTNPGTEVKLYNSEKRDPDHEIGKAKLTLSDQLQPALLPR